MATVSEPSAYLLSYRSQDSEEDKRLNSQHDVIKHAILGGKLVHPYIPLSAVRGAIADVACGTGIWLEDIRRTYFASHLGDHEGSPLLVGFDINAHAFDLTLSSAVKLVQHDCTTTFPVEYEGKFDLVNMRGLAYAIPRDGFRRLLRNVAKILST